MNKSYRMGLEEHTKRMEEFSQHIQSQVRNGAKVNLWDNV